MTQATQAISLAGSVETVTEYFGFAINNILYQRGVYPVECFQQVRKYGIPLMISTHDALNAYLGNLLQQIALWVAERQCRVVALLLVDPATDEVRERWEFTVVEEEEEEWEGAAHFGGGSQPLRASRRGGASRKSEEEVRKEVQAILRQITACVSFLPVLAEPCAFDVVVYTTMDVSNVPSREWEASDSRLVIGGTEMQLKTFTTGFHRVDTRVSYLE